MNDRRTGSRSRNRFSILQSDWAGGRQDVCRGHERPDCFRSDVLDIPMVKPQTPLSGGTQQAVGDQIPALCIHGHEWVVYSTALVQGWLMLQCVECWAMGTIDEPCEHEWSEANHAPSRPYRWHDGTRVTLRGLAAPRVIRAVGGPVCDCPSQSTLPPGTGYERVPGGIWVHPGGLSDAEKTELLDMAEFVGRTDLCSHFLPHFIRSFEEHTGKRQSEATHLIIDRIERWDTKGLHCSPSVVARILREFAAWQSPREGAH